MFDDIDFSRICWQDRCPQAQINICGIGDPAKGNEMSTEDHMVNPPARWNQYDSELVIGLVGAVGTDLRRISDLLAEQLGHVGYKARQVQVSTEVIPYFCEVNAEEPSRFKRTMELMTAGNNARRIAGSDDALAIGAAALISSERSTSDQGLPEPQPKMAYIVNSLKRKEEVERLRRIYRRGFVLVGVAADEDLRLKQLINRHHLSDQDARTLIDRDANESKEPHGQRLAKTFPLADFFVQPSDNNTTLEGEIRRIVELMFGKPDITPCFDEHAMFLAFASALRSGDLSRQVGAVIAREKQVLALGANDCPQPGGGLYWPDRDDHGCLVDVPHGRDAARGFDTNRKEQNEIIERIITLAESKALDTEKLREVLEDSPIRDLTEFGRVVHAEMDAMLSCARLGISVKGATLFTTTFPCHNCAKHIVAAGITRVVYIEPYEKSKAPEFHDDSIDFGFEAKQGNNVLFQPFFGVGPRRFFDLFSMHLSSGYSLKRKADDKVTKFQWDDTEARVRLDMLPRTYIDHELEAVDTFGKFLKKRETD